MPIFLKRVYATENGTAPNEAQLTLSLLTARFDKLLTLTSSRNQNSDLGLFKLHLVYLSKKIIGSISFAMESSPMLFISL